MHPLQVDMTTFTDQDIEKKIQELTQKYFQAMQNIVLFNFIEYVYYLWYTFSKD